MSTADETPIPDLLVGQQVVWIKDDASQYVCRIVRIVDGDYVLDDHPNGALGSDQTPAMRHFAPWGSRTASCGAALASDEAPESPRFTARRDDTTCPDCRDHFTNPADQTPSTDSERDDSLAAKRTQAGVRIARSIAAGVRERGTPFRTDRALLTLDDEVNRLTALLAERDATIERVQRLADQALEDRLVAQEGSPRRLIAYATVDVDDLLAALGPQRTEDDNV